MTPEGHRPDPLVSRVWLTIRVDDPDLRRARADDLERPVVGVGGMPGGIDRLGAGQAVRWPGADRPRRHWVGGLRTLPEQLEQDRAGGTGAVCCVASRIMRVDAEEDGASRDA